MSKLQRNKGSAMLMVIGLMTIVVMLGVTYLAIAHMDAKNTTLQKTKAQADPMVDGSLTLLMDALSNSLRLGANGPYSSFPDPAPATTSHVVPATVQDWRAYVTCPTYWDPSLTTPAEANYNDWLSSTFKDTVQNTWPHVGRFFTPPNQATPWQPPANFFDYPTPSATLGGVTYSLFDTVGCNASSTPDARLFDSGITNSKGQHFYLAIRMIDLSSLACLNTGGTLSTGRTGLGTNTQTTFNITGNVATSWSATATPGRWTYTNTPSLNGPEIMLCSGFPTASTNQPGPLNFAAGNPIAQIAPGMPNVSPTVALTPPGWTPLAFGAATLSSPNNKCLFETMTDRAVTPMSYDLSTLLNTLTSGIGYFDDKSATLYGIHSVRCGYPFTAPSTPPDTSFAAYSQWVGKQLFAACSPTTVNSPSGFQYLPFPIADEAFLRYPPIPDYTGRLKYLKPSDAPTVTGPLGLLNYTSTQNLTTYNCSRSLLRIPSAAGTFQHRVSLYNYELGARTGGCSQATCDALYAELKKFMPQPIQAAHLVANMWAASCYPLDLVNTQVNDFQYKSPDGAVVYGVIPQPFITEAVVGYFQSAIDPTKIDTCSAVQIRNYSGQTIDLGKGLYAVVTGGITRPLSGQLAPGQCLVLYHVNNAAGANPTPGLPGFNITIAAGNGPAAVDEGADGQTPLDLTGANTVQIIRGTNKIPVDLVNATDIPGNRTPAYQPNVVLVLGGGRDDDPDRQRYMVPPMYNPDTKGPVWATVTNCASTLGTLKNGVLQGDVALNNPVIPQGFRLFTGPMCSVGNVADLFITGPDATTDLSHNLSNTANSPANIGPSGTAFAQDYTRGKVDFRAKLPTTPVKMDYPDVPWGCLIPELIECAPTDTSRTDDPSRIYGRININTASAAVLTNLPWPYDTAHITGSAIADYIIAYRDKRATADGVMDYTNRASATGITSLRSFSDGTGNSAAPGFLTPGELAIPLGDYVKNVLASQSVDVNAAGYNEYRDVAYKMVANCITVNSDTFAAYVVVQLYDTTVTQQPAGTGSLSQTHYLAVFDRSNCRAPGDKPAILLTTPLP